jgi:hypothetical protein
MSSQGTGSDITLQDAIDLLHKLMTEATKVVAILSAPPRLKASVAGKVKLAPDDSIWVVDEQCLPPHFISFDPRLAIRRTYGDTRTMPPIPEEAPKGLPSRFASSLCFVFAEGMSLCLFEFSDES